MYIFANFVSDYTLVGLYVKSRLLDGLYAKSARRIKRNPSKVNTVLLDDAITSTKLREERSELA